MLFAQVSRVNSKTHAAERTFPSGFCRSVRISKRVNLVSISLQRIVCCMCLQND